MISIIMPTHNRASLLPRAIHSVLAQTVADWELIIVADNCSDDTAAVVAAFDDNRIRFCSSLVNVGGAQARNIGLDLAQGDFIAFLDDDDEWLPNKLAYQLRLFEQHEDICLASSSYIRVEDRTEKAVPIPTRLVLDDLYYYNVCGSFSFCMTTRALVGDLRLDSSLKACQDWDFWIRLLQQTKLSCYTATTPLVRYHMHTAIRISTSAKNHYQAYLLFMRKHYTAMSQQQLAYNYALLNNEYCCLSDVAWPERMLISLRSFRFAQHAGHNSLLRCVKLLLYPFWHRFRHCTATVLMYESSQCP